MSRSTGAWRTFAKTLENEKTSINASAHETPVLFFAKVVRNDDPRKANRIKVRIPVIDQKASNASLPWCVPAGPSNIHVVPQPEDLVIVIAQNPWNATLSERFYIGPIFSSTIGEDFTTVLAGLGLQKGDE